MKVKNLLKKDSTTSFQWEPRHPLDWRGYVVFAKHTFFTQDDENVPYKKTTTVHIQWHMIRAAIRRAFVMPAVRYAMVPAMLALVAVFKPQHMQFAFAGALAFDASSSNDTDGATSIDITHVCAASAVLAVTIAYGTKNSSISTPATRTATYNSVSMTEKIIDDGGSGLASVFGLSNPSSGSNTIHITRNNNAEISGYGMSFTGADSVTPFGNTAHNDSGGTSGPFSNNITVSRAGNYTVEAQMANPAGTTLTNIAEQSSQTQVSRFNTSNGEAAAGAYKLQASAGSTALSYSWSGGNSQPVWAAMEINGALASLSPSNPLMTRTAVKRASSY